MRIDESRKEVNIHIDEIFPSIYDFLQWLNSGKDPREFISGKQEGYRYHVLPLTTHCACEECQVFWPR